MNRRNGPIRVVAALLVVGMLLSAGLAGVVSVLASGPEEGVQQTENHQAAAADPIVDEDLSSDDGGRFSVAAAAVIGIGISALAAFALFVVVKPRARADES
jgi:hypothetical protein